MDNFDFNIEDELDNIMLSKNKICSLNASTANETFREHLCDSLSNSKVFNVILKDYYKIKSSVLNKCGTYEIVNDIPIEYYSRLSDHTLINLQLDLTINKWITLTAATRNILYELDGYNSLVIDELNELEYKSNKKLYKPILTQLINDILATNHIKGNSSKNTVNMGILTCIISPDNNFIYLEVYDTNDIELDSSKKPKSYPNHAFFYPVKSQIEFYKFTDVLSNSKLSNNIVTQMNKLLAKNNIKLAKNNLKIYGELIFDKYNTLVFDFPPVQYYNYNAAPFAECLYAIANEYTRSESAKNTYKITSMYNNLISNTTLIYNRNDIYYQLSDKTLLSIKKYITDTTSSLLGICIKNNGEYLLALYINYNKAANYTLKIIDNRELKDFIDEIE